MIKSHRKHRKFYDCNNGKQKLNDEHANNHMLKILLKCRFYNYIVKVQEYFIVFVEKKSCDPITNYIHDNHMTIC